MARVTVEDCLENIENRFKLVLLASERARQLSNMSDPFVERGKDKDTVVALREIAGGFVSNDNIASFRVKNDYQVETPEVENIESE